MNFVPPETGPRHIGEIAEALVVAAGLASSDPHSNLILLGEETLRHAMRQNRVKRRHVSEAAVTRLRLEYRHLRAALFAVLLQSTPAK